MIYYYEVLWYEGDTEEEALNSGNYTAKTFASRKQALNYYEKHKAEPHRWGWWVTKRYSDDDSVAEDIIY